jgi:UDP-N-acetylmuramyl pentapeptide phosphotransferase/UDP-N-acetylglucosamine-1-phosphate transferase
LALLIGLACALVLVPVARRVGLRIGAVDEPHDDPLKIHARAVPVLGGAAVVVACLLAAAATTRPPTAAIAAILVALGAGLLDDVRRLAPVPQAALQALAGLVLALAVAGHGAPAALAVVALVVACTNGVNWIDGQDGLAGGLAAIAALGLAALGPADARALGLALGGALGGFLLWNRPPARIFLGNGGAYAVGTALAALAVAAVERHGWRGALAAALCLGVFAFELAFTVLRRAPARTFATGDRGHSYDLAAANRSRGGVTLVFCAFGAAAAAGGLVVVEAPLGVALATAALAAVVALAAAHRLLARPAAELAKGLT